MYAMENRSTSINNFKNYNPKIMSQRASSAQPGYTYFLSKQSPKLGRGSLRKNDDSFKKLFSLLDIPASKVARSLKMPLQYERPDNINHTIESADSFKEQMSKTNGFDSIFNSKAILERNIKTASNSIRPNYNEKVMVQYPPHASNLRISKTSQSQRNFADNLPGQNVKEIKKKMQDSDVFFLKKTNAKVDNFNTLKDWYNNKDQTIYNDSDIFLRKDDALSRSKSGEKYFFKKKEKLYDTTCKSNSEWIDKNLYQTLLGHSSRDYHILNPGIKHISKTRQDIINDTATYNPIYRQKSLCEFIDLNRVGVPNPNKEFLKAFRTSKNAFCKNTNICANYLDIHREYRDLSDRPFVKKPL
jgi:hypothetical protein